MGLSESRHPEVIVNGRKYHRGRSIGQGAYARVYALYTEPYHQRLLLAAKVFDKRTVLDTKSFEYLQLERRVMIRLHCAPFVCNILAAYQTPREIAIVTPLMQGGDLLALIQESKHRHLPENVVSFFAGNVLLALEYLHRHNIIHRDVKPGNILIREGYAYLADFNCCKELQNDQDQGGSKTGTLNYMAPEVVKESPYGTEVDWWSFGVTIYECLASERPFVHDEQEVLEAMIVRGIVHYPRFFSGHALAVLNGLIRVNPADRFTAEQLKLHPFFRCMDWDEMLRQNLKSPVSSKYVASMHPEGEFDDLNPISPPGPVEDREQAIFSDWEWPKPTINHHVPSEQTPFFEEVAFFENPALLGTKGAVLREFENPEQGKMIFELSELRIGVIYLTESDYRLERFSELEALIVGDGKYARMCIVKPAAPVSKRTSSDANMDPHDEQHTQHLEEEEAAAAAVEGDSGDTRKQTQKKTNQKEYVSARLQQQTHHHQRQHRNDKDENHAVSSPPRVPLPAAKRVSSVRRFSGSFSSKEHSTTTSQPSSTSRTTPSPTTTTLSPPLSSEQSDLENTNEKKPYQETKTTEKRNTTQRGHKHTTGVVRSKSTRDETCSLTDPKGSTTSDAHPHEYHHRHRVHPEHHQEKEEEEKKKKTHHKKMHRSEGEGEEQDHPPASERRASHSHVDHRHPRRAHQQQSHHHHHHRQQQQQQQQQDPRRSPQKHKQERIDDDDDDDESRSSAQEDYGSARSSVPAIQSENLISKSHPQSHPHKHKQRHHHRDDDKEHKDRRDHHRDHPHEHHTGHKDHNEPKVHHHKEHKDHDRKEHKDHHRKVHKDHHRKVHKDHQHKEHTDHTHEKPEKHGDQVTAGSANITTKE
eukprot:CAMPEP_0177651164 /NCGR_PEP_ID=MMETSP0447-20121125/12377_1 /TAXON_ID=0 /ORGANISM="Stygamoeba regulata, Strain BSH-02190019" /LENGTH=869 /DNA_ID=CAMNT_0019154177 /DNA_START=51 /DNA_END=2660 /DNA_ORIENTATION=-